GYHSLALVAAPIVTITTQPSKPTYGDCPAKELGKDSLILITHGAIPPWETPETSTAWVDSMSNSIALYLTAHNLNNWQVLGYKWIDKAKFTLDPNSSQFGPQSSLNNAFGEGGKLGKCLASRGWTHLHLISHSAGAGLIQAVLDVIKPNSAITVHCTFLDPFVGLTFDGVSKYGMGANWADHYFSHDLETGGSIYQVTEKPLDRAYNVNVTQLNKVRDFGAFVSSGDGAIVPCYRAVTYHGWAVDFYSNTIRGNVSSQYEGFGFPLSEEGGNWSYALSHYTRGNKAPHPLR